MCCCKWCQYYFESIYWHCIEKHFCFDVDIALYEDEDTIKQSDYTKESQQYNLQLPPDTTSSCRTSNNNIYDNMAFYDNVAMIANRSIFIIDPQDPKKQTSTESLNFDDIERRNSIDKSLSKDMFIDNDARARVITEQPKSKRISFPDVVTSNMEKPKSEPNLTETRNVDNTSSSDLDPYIPIPPLIRTNTTSLSSLATISEENHDKSIHEPNPKLLNLPTPITVKMRKKSLHERRVSKSLTLDIDYKRQELPIIRQSSFPKFYIDTPDVTQNTSSIGPNSIQALETPVMPNIFQFDLKTVVQMQNDKLELEVHQNQLRRSVTSVKENNRIQQIRDKLKPIKLYRNASTQSLHSQMHQ